MVKHALPLLFLALLPCAAKGPQEPAPMSLEIHGLAPTSDLKTYVDRVGSGGSWSYTFYSRAWHKGSITLGARAGYNAWVNTNIRHEVHSVDFGPEVTLYPLRPFQGWYLRLAEGPSSTSLTRREGELLKEDKYLRWQTVFATGWRFRNNISVEALVQNVNLDERMNLSSVGLGVRAQF